jgi:ABC-type dipeptide/oligopeptide/nickel transport system permease subunit
LVKITIASAAGYFAAVGSAALMGATVVAIVPIMAGVAISLVAGYFLNVIDNHFKITESLIQ